MGSVWGPGKFFDVKARKTVTFDDDVGVITLFTVTGHVAVKLIAVCITNVASAGAANIEVGIAGATSTIIATTVATAVDAEEIWHDATPDAKIELLSVAAEYIITDGSDIILTPSAQVDSGVIAFYLDYAPLSVDGAVVAA